MNPIRLAGERPHTVAVAAILVALPPGPQTPLAAGDPVVVTGVDRAFPGAPLLPPRGGGGGGRPSEAHGAPANGVGDGKAASR